MTQQELFELHTRVCEQALEVMSKKNADYSGASVDPFSNFRGSLHYNVHPVIGIFVRISDKFKRVQAYINRGDLKVSDESLEDSIVDVINYSILALGMIIEEEENKRTTVSLNVPIKPTPVDRGTLQTVTGSAKFVNDKGDEKDGY